MGYLCGLRADPAIPAGTVALVSALLLVGPGCGDSGEPVTKEQLIEQGDEVCREGMERFAEIQREPPANAHEAVDQTTELIDVSSDQLDALRDLEPPEELRARYDDYLSAREDVLDLLEKGRDAAEQQDTRAYEAAQLEADKGAAERHKLAQSIGFKDCSKPQTAAAPSVAG